MTQVTRPARVDDTGAGQDGTVLDAAYIDSILDEIDDQCHDTVNTTIQPKDTTAEVVDARGSKATLDTRLSVSLAADGSLISVGTAYEVRNYWPDSLFMLWAAGDAAAPDGWTLSGAGAAIARCGAGGVGYEASAPADSTILPYGKFCAKITYGSAAAKLTRTMVATAKLPPGAVGRFVSAAIYCNCSTASCARIVVDDGVGTTFGGATGNGSFHVGDGADALLYVTHEIAAGATKIDIYLEAAVAGSAYFGAGTWALVNSAIPLTDYVPERYRPFLVAIPVRGDADASADPVNDYELPMPFPAILSEIQLNAVTGPAGSALIYQPLKAAAACFATDPQIDDGDTDNLTAGVGDSPDGTYAERCFARGDVFSIDTDAVGSGTAGADVSIVAVFHAAVNDFDLFGV